MRLSLPTQRCTCSTIISNPDIYVALFRRGPPSHLSAHSSTTPGRTGNPRPPLKNMQSLSKKLEIVGRKEKVATGGLSPSVTTPRSFLHFLPVVIHRLMKRRRIFFNHFSLRQPLAISFFPLKGKVSRPPMPPIFGLGKPSQAPWLSASEVP